MIPSSTLTPMEHEMRAIIREQGFLTRKTAERYKPVVRSLDRVIVSTYGHHISFAWLTPMHVEAYAWARLLDGKSRRTVQTELSAIRFFHDMMRLRGKRVVYEGRLPTLKEMDVPDLDDADDAPSEPFAWSQEEHDQVIAVLRQRGHHRTADLLILARELGLRIHEAVRLNRSDAEPRRLERRVLHVKGKNGRERDVPLTDEAIEVLRRNAELTPRGQKLFVRDDEQSHKVIAEVQEHIRSVRPREALHFHGERHAFAQHRLAQLQEEGVSSDLRRYVVSVLMGHSRISITDTYAPRGPYDGPANRSGHLSDYGRMALKIALEDAIWHGWTDLARKIEKRLARG